MRPFDRYDKTIGIFPVYSGFESWFNQVIGKSMIIVLIVLEIENEVFFQCNAISIYNI